MGKTADPVAQVRRFVERHLPTIQAPGVAIGLTSRDGPLGVVTVGHANLPTREPVQPEHRFQIGSISKSFTAIAVLQEHEASRLDLHAPVTEYLPWFEVRSPSGPVTLHHLLTHTAGLPTGRDFTGEGLRELWALRESGVGFAPGTRFHYSNAGYKALGLVLEAIAGQPWWQLVQDRVLDPLGMGATEPITTPEGRSRSVTGHVPPFDDRPRHPSHGLVPPRGSRARPPTGRSAPRRRTCVPTFACSCRAAPLSSPSRASPCWSRPPWRIPTLRASSTGTG